MVGIFLLIIAFGLFGPPLGDDNLAVALTWRLWWLLLPLSFALVGRFWCAACPVGAITDLTARIHPVERRLEGPLHRYGTWIAATLFGGLFWMGMLWHVCCWPRATAYWLLGFTGAALSATLIFGKRIWCRHLCPIGAVGGLLSLVAPLGIRGERRLCHEKCLTRDTSILRQERRDCPLMVLPMALEDNRHCNLCGECVKGCSKGALRLRLRLPGSDLWRLRRVRPSETALALLILSLALTEALQMTPLYSAYMKWALEGGLGMSYEALFTVSLVILIAGVFGLYWGASYVIGERSDWPNLSPGYIPIALAGYLGVFLFRLGAQGGRAIEVALGQLGFAGLMPGPPLRASIYTINPALQGIQLSLLLLGMLLAIYVFWKLSARTGISQRALPHLGLAGGISLILAYFFLSPAGVILH